jgi:pimeloyl-[acyl-carrier protein] methyl ester esterase
MKTYIRRRDKNKQLIVVFGGWGTDEYVFAPLCNDEFDYILFYNYSADEALILPETKKYEKITLIAWSLGVWAAEYLFPRILIKPDVTIAVNGTPIPADDHYGIPLSVFETALNNITEENIERFYYRMFGTIRKEIAGSEVGFQRTLKSLKDELRWLYNRIMEQKEPGFRWDYAVSGENDNIFPALNQISYWNKTENTKHIILPLPHFFFYNFKSFTDFINFVEENTSVVKKPAKSSDGPIKDL